MIKFDCIGDGTFSRVYSAKFASDSTKLLSIKRNIVDSEYTFSASVRELDILTQMRFHPYIVEIKYVSVGDPFQDGNCMSPIKVKNSKNDKIHFIFDKADMNLKSYMVNMRPDFRTTKKLMIQFLLGLEFFHKRGYVHRDLKLNNILVFDSKTNPTANICDFGLSKVFTKQSMQSPGVTTSWYRAPEVCLHEEYDQKIDMWGVGCILFEMISGRSFISGVDDNDSHIIQKILSLLPVELDVQTMNRRVKPNKHIMLPAKPKKVKRCSFLQQLYLSNTKTEEFNRDAGDIQLFLDFLNKTICFDPVKRMTSTESIDHPFFDDHRTLIDSVRLSHPPKPVVQFDIPIYRCFERNVIVTLASYIFSNRGRLRWYSHRILFQSIDLFDRYLSIMMKNVSKNSIESKFSGRIHSEEDTILRYLSLLYLSIKYFSTLTMPISFVYFVDSLRIDIFKGLTGQYQSEDFTTYSSLLKVEMFETSFIKEDLMYYVYRETCYESASLYNKKLNEKEIGKLLDVYSNMESTSRATGKSIYKLYYFESVSNLINNPEVPGDSTDNSNNTK
jgi:serine/threonine protein kinase